MRRQVYTKDKSRKNSKKMRIIKVKNEKINMTKDKTKKQKKKKGNTAHKKLDQRKVGSLGTTIQKKGRTSLGGGTRRILRQKSGNRCARTSSRQ
jgi:hypothetical protein